MSTMILKLLVHNPAVMRALKDAGRGADMEQLAASLKSDVPEVDAAMLAMLADLYWRPAPSTRDEGSTD